MSGVVPLRWHICFPVPSVRINLKENSSDEFNMDSTKEINLCICALGDMAYVGIMAQEISPLIGDFH